MASTSRPSAPSRGRRWRARRAAVTREDGVDGSPPKGSRGTRSVRPGTWYGRPTDGAPVRPTIDPASTGPGCHCRAAAAGRSVRSKPTRDRTGDSTWGVGHGTGNGRSPRGGSREGSRASLTSRVTGSFGHQARKAVGLAGLIEQLARFIAPIALRTTGGRSSCPGRSGGARRPRRRVGTPTDPPRIEIGLDDARRRDQFRVAGHGAGHPVDVRRLERRDLPERMAVELAEVDDMVECAIEPGRSRPTEIPDASPLGRPGRRRGAWRLLAIVPPA
jgi:hypothetical protein